MENISRRSFIGGASALVAGLAFVGMESPAYGRQVLPEFPDGIPVQRAQFKNWDGALVTEPLWTAVPRVAADVVTLANWAHTSGYRLRPRGYKHSWSPMTVNPGTTESERIILVDTTVHLTAMSKTAGNRVRVQTGAKMQSLLAYMESQGLGVISAPAPGDVTVGGVLAVNGHGTAVPARGESLKTGMSFGTVSNLVASLTAVVWDPRSQRYEQKTFDRADSDASALLTNLGRAFLTEVEIIGVPNYNVNCLCHTDISLDELFASPEKAGRRSLSSLLDEAGRVGLIWYVLTDYPWVQVWKQSPNKPAAARRTSGPFNFPFADNLPDQVEQLLDQLVTGHQHVTPQFCQAVHAATVAGLTLTGARNMWGPSKDFINFVKPTTLLVTAGSYAIITKRSEVQAVVHEYATLHREKVAEYAKKGQYPINSCVEIRVTGLDDPTATGLPGAQAPDLSGAAPVPGHPEWDTAIWLDTLTLPNTEGKEKFYAEFERDFFQSFPPDRGLVRVEWAKRWGHGPEGAWSDPATLHHSIPASFPRFSHAREVFERHDPHGIFSAPMWDRLIH